MKIVKSKQYTRKDDIKLLMSIISAFLLTVWLVSPPGNKFLQICFWSNNVKFAIVKMTSNYQATEYKFHRNNAVYLAKMYKNKNQAIKEMNEAIATLPASAPDSILKSLYKDRAYIKLYAKDYQGALSDFISSDNIGFNDNLKVAMLFKEAGNYKEAQNYCNNILKYDASAYAGFACLSDLYSSCGKLDVSKRLWDLAIDRRPNNPRAYIDRANIKKRMGDIQGYEADIKKAKEFSPTININESIIDEALNPKILSLAII